MSWNKKIINRFKGFFIVLLCIFVSSGCRYVQNAKNYFSKDFNAAGALSNTTKSYEPIEKGTIRLRSSDIWNRKHFSGTRTSALWGLFTYTDY